MWSIGLASFAACIGSLALIGWDAGIPVLRTYRSGFAQMQPFTAIAVMALGLAGLYAAAGHRRVVLLPAAFVLAIALLVVADHAVPGPSGVWMLLWPEAVAAQPHEPTPGRPAAVTAAAFLGLALAFALIPQRRRSIRLAGVGAATFALVVTALPLYAYALGVPAAGSLGLPGRPAIPTVLALTALAAAALLLRPQDGWAGTLTGLGPGARTARRLTLAVTLGPATLGFLAIEASRAALIGIDERLVVVCILTIVALSAAVFLNADGLDIAAAKQRVAEQRFEVLASAAREAVAIHDGERLWYGNAAFARLFMIAPATIGGTPLASLFRPSDHAGVSRWLASGNGDAFECCSLTATGDEVPVRLWRGSRAGLEPGRGHVLIIQDLTPERAHQAALRVALSDADAERQRLRDVLDALPLAIVLAEAPSGRVVFGNRTIESVFGHPLHWSQSIGDYQDWVAYRGESDRRVLPAEWPMAITLRTGAPAVRDFQYERAPGRRVWLRAVSAPLHDTEGRLTGAVAAAMDIDTERKAREAVLESEDRLRRAVRFSPFPCMIHADDGSVVQISDSWSQLTGYPAEMLSSVEAWTDLAYGERAALVRAEIGRFYDAQGAAEEGEYAIRTASGEMRIWSFASAPLGRDRHGRRLVYSVAMDVTERRRSAERQATLASELSHRVKNIIAVVQSIAVQTAARSETLDDFAPRFHGRLRALGRAHGQVLRSDWAGADVAQLAREELAPHESAIAIVGPPLFLPPKEAVALGLILHELATNATKYGALSQVEGRVTLSWTVERGARGRFVTLHWRESLGRRADLGPAGFGVNLIRRATQHELGGEAIVLPQPQGLLWTIAFPLAEPAPLDAQEARPRDPHPILTVASGPPNPAGRG